jgi:hypothetical protein
MKASSGCSVSRAVGTVIMSAVGVGLNFIPQVLGSCGLLGGSIVLLCGSALTIFSTYLVQETVKLTKDSECETSFKAIAKLLYGDLVSKLTDGLLKVTLLAILSLLLSLMGTRLKSVFRSQVDWRVFVPVSAFACLPFIFLRKIRYVGLMSLAGVFLIFGFVCVVVTKATLDAVYELSEPSDVLYFTKAATASQKISIYFASLSTTFFSTFMVTAIPPVLQQMTFPSDFYLVNYFGNGSVLVINLLMSIPCYLAYGSAIDRGVLDVLSAGQCSPLVTVAEVFMLLACVPKYVTVFVCLAPDATCGRILVFFSTAVLSLVMPRLDLIVGLIGSISAVYLSVFVPVAFYFRAKRRNHLKLTKREIVSLTLLTLAGFAIAVFGISVSI